MAKGTQTQRATTPSNAAAPTAADKPKVTKRVDYIKAANVDKNNPNLYPFREAAGPNGPQGRPGGYDWAKHKPLKKKDFAKPSTFFLYKAEEMEHKGQLMRTKAEELRSGGEGKGQSKMNRFKKFIERAQAVQGELSDQGVDTAKIMAELLGPEKLKQMLESIQAQQTAAAAAK